MNELEQLKMDNARLRDKVESLEADLQNSVTWSVEDFAYRASELESYDDRIRLSEIYDPDKFEDALKTMIRKHDAGTGITWDTIDFWLDEMCRRDAPPMKVGQIIISRGNQSRWKIVMLDDENNFLVESCKTQYQMWAKPSHFII